MPALEVHVTRDDLLSAMNAVMRRALSIFDRPGVSEDVFASQIKDHILDSWYNFADCGVTSRADLKKITVTITWHDDSPPQWVGDGGRSREINIGFVGTPLESKKPDDPVLHGLLSD